MMLDEATLTFNGDPFEVSTPGHEISVLIMPPTSKKLEGHIASGLFVRALCFLMHSMNPAY